MRSPSKKVLVIEDDNDIRDSLVELLTDAGFEASQAENGFAALEVLRSGLAPHVILLDLMMPVMDGFKFREQQINDPNWAGIPVIVMSADGHVVEKQERTGAVAYLKKPVDIHTLIAVVRKQFAAL